MNNKYEHSTLKSGMQIKIVLVVYLRLLYTQENMYGLLN